MLQVQSINIWNGVQLLEITAKRKEIENTQISTEDNEQVEPFEEATENDQQLVSNSPDLR